MKEKTDSDLNRRISMAKSFLDAAQLLGFTLGDVIPIFAESEEEARAIVPDIKFGRKMTAHFLYAIIFELCIKIIWGIEHKTTPPFTHDILSLYNELSTDSRRKITELYEKQVGNIEAIISDANSGRRNRGGDIVNLSVNLQSLQEALASNAETIKNFKYEGKIGGKSSVFCSILWTQDGIYTIPMPDLIIFPKFLLEYAILLQSKLPAHAKK